MESKLSGQKFPDMWGYLFVTEAICLPCDDATTEWMSECLGFCVVSNSISMLSLKWQMALGVDFGILQVDKAFMNHPWPLHVCPYFMLIFQKCDNSHHTMQVTSFAFCLYLVKIKSKEKTKCHQSLSSPVDLSLDDNVYPLLPTSTTSSNCIEEVQIWFATLY